MLENFLSVLGVEPGRWDGKTGNILKRGDTQKTVYNDDFFFPREHFYMTEVEYAWELMYDFEMPVLGVLCSLLGGDGNMVRLQFGQPASCD